MLIIKKKTKNLLIIVHLIIALAITVISFAVSLYLERPECTALLFLVVPVVIVENFIQDMPVEPDTVYEYLRYLGYSHETAADVAKEMEKYDYNQCD
jgi:hypothetical protein